MSTEENKKLLTLDLTQLAPMFSDRLLQVIQDTCHTHARHIKEDMLDFPNGDTKEDMERWAKADMEIYIQIANWKQENK